jgi:ADP-ribose pyrophosphatase YjhB (NUDIX family)
LHRRNAEPVWSLPGGRVEHGEAAADAVVRELQEELGEHVQCERLLWVVENFFWQEGRPHHELGLYFLATLAADSALLFSTGPFLGIEQHAQLSFAWFDRSQLQRVDVRPSFLVRALAEREFQFEHVVHREPDAS